MRLFGRIGLEILAFPCNQFGGQEPGSNSEIKQFACSRFKAEFPIFDKVHKLHIHGRYLTILMWTWQNSNRISAPQVDVNGPNTAPVYQFLKSSAGGFLGDLIKWNFEKFLVDKNGKVVERDPPTTSPFQIEVWLILLLYLGLPFWISLQYLNFASFGCFSYYIGFFISLQFIFFDTYFSRLW